MKVKDEGPREYNINQLFVLANYPSHQGLMANHEFHSSHLLQPILTHLMDSPHKDHKNKKLLMKTWQDGFTKTLQTKVNNKSRSLQRSMAKVLP